MNGIRESPSDSTRLENEFPLQAHLVPDVEAQARYSSPMTGIPFLAC